MWIRTGNIRAVRWKKQYQKWKFDKKMFVFISMVMWISVIVLILGTVISSVRVITEQAKQLVVERVNTQVSNLESNFLQYENILWSVMIDPAVQTYFQDESEYRYYDMARTSLKNISNMADSIQFIGLISADGRKNCIVGHQIPYSDIAVSEYIMEDYNHSLKMSTRESSLRALTYNSKYSSVKGAFLTLYQPVYSASRLNQYLGMIYLNIDDLNLSGLMEKASTDELKQDNYYLYSDGTILACSNLEEIGIKLENISKMTGTEGTYWERGNLWIYHKLQGWEYMYVTKISLFELCKGNIISLVSVVLILLCFLFLMQKLASKIIKDAYHPWKRVAETMNSVTNGKLEVRLYEEDTDPDMEMISCGFNRMMENIIQLMNQVKEDQHLLEQVKFDALQSQIQPHFLYNTLDCIHWQAVMDGNTEVSEMIKSLAAYYRICLSKGHDVITLREEVAHVANYLYIQQMRYGEMLSYEISDTKGVEEVQIPKLTLQPLVENSIYHGIKVKNGKKGHITVSVAIEKSWVLISVEDDGTGMNDEQIAHMNENIERYEENFGYGVRNANRRIQLLFGNSYGLHYRKNANNGVSVDVRIPLERGEMKNRGIMDELYFR